MSKKIIAIVPAAGVGERAQASKETAFLPASEGVSGGHADASLTAGATTVVPKQYRLLNGEPMLRVAVKALLADPRIQQVRVAVAAQDGWVQECLQGLPRTVWRACGGPSRAATVAAALQDAQLDDDDWVLVHDAARPGLPADALERLLDVCLSEGVSGLLAQPVADTVKQSICVASTQHDAVFSVQGTVPRESLWLAQTPQMFPAGLLLQALTAAEAAQATVTDEASALELMGYQPRLVRGAARNFKVTWPEDFNLMEKWL